jgi:large subunit ribosomal protein L25
VAIPFCEKFRSILRRWLYHLSFFAVAGQDSLEVEVAIQFVGDAVGVKLEDGVLDPVLTHLQVRCAPDNIPEVIEVDVSQMHLKDILYVINLFCRRVLQP